MLSWVNVKGRDFLRVFAVGVVKIVHESCAPRVLEDDFACFRVGVSDCKILTVEKGVKNGVAMNFCVVRVGQFCGFSG